MSGGPSGRACGGDPREPCRSPGGSLLYLSRDDLESLGVTMGEVVDTVDRGCAAKGRGEVVMPPKLSLHGEGDAYSQVMAATLPGDGGLGAKWVTLFPQNAAAGLPITNGLVVLSDPKTGLPAAVMDAGAITAWRTGRERRRRRQVPRPWGRRLRGRARLRRAGASRRARAGGGAAGAPQRALPRRGPGRRGGVLRRTRRRAPGGGVRTVPGAGRRGPRRRRRRHRDHDDGGHPAAARLRAARARGAGGGARLRRRLEPGGHGGVRPVLLRRHGDRAGHAGGRYAARRHPLKDQRGPGRAGRRPRRRPRRPGRAPVLSNLGMALEDVVTGELALRRARELGIGRELPL